MGDRPEYCPDPLPDPCPLCGATEGGDDAVNGVCQALRSGPMPGPLVDLVLIDKKTGKILEARS